jgi:hypothetical protein
MKSLRKHAFLGRRSRSTYFEQRTTKKAQSTSDIDENKTKANNWSDSCLGPPGNYRLRVRQSLDNDF